MRVGIYNEPSGSGPGGAERMSAVLAGHLASAHTVDVLHHRVGLTREMLESFTGRSLNGAAVKYVERVPFAWPEVHSPVARLRAARQWQADLSAPYDLFVAITHTLPPFCHAAWGVLVCLLPFQAPHAARSPAGSGWLGHLKFAFGTAYYRWELQQRLATYQKHLAISSFSRSWMKTRWSCAADVLCPPVDLLDASTSKEDAIVSVGRFTQTGHCKNQIEMIAAFQDLARDLAPSWRYTLAGAVGSSDADRAYLAAASEVAGPQVELVANASPVQIQQRYSRAKIFWHAAGYGRDEQHQPELVEHFGISTVEAMSAGCVPVVIAKGGQREIVRHGRDGFLWNTLDELKEYTRLLAYDETRRAKMAAQAAKRAQEFSAARFCERFDRILQSLGSTGRTAAA